MGGSQKAVSRLSKAACLESHNALCPYRRGRPSYSLNCEVRDLPNWGHWANPEIVMFSLYLFAGVQQFPWESLFRRPRGRSPRTYGLDRRGSLSSSIDFKTLSRLGRVINLWTMSGAVVGSRSHYGAPVQGANEGVRVSAAAVLRCCTAGGRQLPCQAKIVAPRPGSRLLLSRRHCPWASGVVRMCSGRLSLSSTLNCAPRGLEMESRLALGKRAHLRWSLSSPTSGRWSLREPCTTIVPSLVP